MPGFDRATEIGLLAMPWAVLGKVTGSGDAARYAVGSPVPRSAMVAEPTPDVVLLSVSMPVRVPAAEGEKVMLTVQELPAGNEAPQVLEGRLKSPVMWNCSPPAATVPVFKIVAD